MAPAPAPTPAKPTLIPINLHNPPEHAELQAQRRICGWDYTDAALLAWRQKQDAGLKSFFWITIPAALADTSPQAGSTDPETGAVRAGHISLDAYADPPDPELARADRSILTIQTFFVRPEYRSLGLGRAAMDLVETMAGQEPYGSPRCQYVAVTSMSKRYYYDETAGPDGTGLWALLGREVPRVCAVDWYERRGYVRWKSEKRWTDVSPEGKEVTLVADFLRKPVRAASESSRQWWWLLPLSGAILGMIWWRKINMTARV
ncbi:hypothetical protein HFD88_000538 [Aspergillus terreus]|nr:hypothetical protein HFD88_000538 [Aspergillus terreus]